jgi:hypothetical protein
MEAELQELQQLYETQIKEIESHARNLMQRVNSWRISFFYRKYYYRQIMRWMRSRKERLETLFRAKQTTIKNKYHKPPTRRKQACLVGINYTGTQYALNGCVNDVYKFRHLLIHKYNYDPKDVRLIINQYATRNTILREFTRLVENAISGDTICFSFSGHGVNAKDHNKDEKDGMDELIVTADFYGIMDDEFKAILKKHLKEGVKMFALFDNCHSGTILDLRYQYKNQNTELTVHDKYSDTPGQVICLSGCRDDQVSMDAYLNNQYNGALTWALVDVLYKNGSMSWTLCVSKLRELLQSKQLPQLTSGKQMEAQNELVQL